MIDHIAGIKNESEKDIVIKKIQSAILENDLDYDDTLD